MAYTEQDLQKLEAAIKLGVKHVEYADRKLVYNSLEEMRSLREQMKRELGQASKGIIKRVAAFSKGLK